jgi:hypothetical protein
MFGIAGPTGPASHTLQHRHQYPVGPDSGERAFWGARDARPPGP